VSDQPFVALMAEDNPHDVVATRRAWKKNNIVRSYDLGANAYVVKPVGFWNLSQAVRTISLF
jgi:DNA-binding NarL/FixJ family response regulator